MIMDAKLFKLLKKYPPLTIKFECSVCMIEFNHTYFYDKDREEYEKFTDALEKVKQLENEGELLENLIFVDMCKDCRNK